MAKYFDFVLCEDSKGEQVLCRAPHWSLIAKGDEVVVEDVGRATVSAVMSLNSEEKGDIDFVMKATGTPEDGVKKITAKVFYHEMEYEEDEKK